MPRRSSNPSAATTPQAQAEARPAQLSPLALVKAAFTHHLRVRRARGGLKLVLEPEAQPPPTESVAGPPHNDQVALQMHADLRAALDAAPSARNVFHHLAAVERQLWRRGALFIHDLPLATLQRIAEQLCAVGRSAPGLERLADMVADALAMHERLAREREALMPPSSFFVDHKLEVSEATPSDFVAVAGAAAALPHDS